jgi:hypothetical protein
MLKVGLEIGIHEDPYSFEMLDPNTDSAVKNMTLSLKKLPTKTV